MRKVAPDRPGNAVSQNNWSVVNAKPIFGRLTVTAENSIQIAKASSSAGIEIARLRLAMRLPVCSQKAGSSGCQSVRTLDLRGAFGPAETIMMRLHPSIAGWPAAADNGMARPWSAA